MKVIEVDFSISNKEFFDWLEDNGWEQLDFVEDPENVFNDFLNTEYDVEYNFDNGYFEINSNDVPDFVKDHKVLLYHHTSSSIIDSIKQKGLMAGVNKTNPYKNSYSGVYLTTEYSSPTVEGYKYHATQKLGGEPVTLKVIVDYKDLSKDSDDSDIQSGNYQFITKRVEPENIIFDMKNGGKLNRSWTPEEIKQKVSKYGSREGTDMTDWVEDEVYTGSSYVLRELEIENILENDIDAKFFVNEVISNPEMYNDIVSWDNPNTKYKPILLNEKGLVKDGYGRMANSVHKGVKTIYAYVPENIEQSLYALGGKLSSSYFNGDLSFLNW
jgi:hypothetical protein